jgi:hypothetical protein
MVQEILVQARNNFLCDGIDVQRLNSATCTVVKSCGSHRRNYSACSVLQLQRFVQLFSFTPVIRIVQSGITVDMVHVTSCDETLCAVARRGGRARLEFSLVTFFASRQRK